MTMFFAAQSRWGFPFIRASIPAPSLRGADYERIINRELISNVSSEHDWIRTGDLFRCTCIENFSRKALRIPRFRHKFGDRFPARRRTILWRSFSNPFLTPNLCDLTPWRA